MGIKKLYQKTPLLDRLGKTWVTKTFIMISWLLVLSFTYPNAKAQNSCDPADLGYCGFPCANNEICTQVGTDYTCTLNELCELPENSSGDVVFCVHPENMGKCNTTECSAGKKCVAVYANPAKNVYHGVCMYDPSCNIVGPPVTCGDPGTLGQCGQTAGCPDCQKCVKEQQESGSYAFTCVYKEACPGCSGAGGTGSDTPPGEEKRGPVRPNPFKELLAEFGILGVEGLLGNIYKILLPTAIIIGLFMIAKAGYTLMTSQGDPQKTQMGKEDLTAAVMGLIVALLSITILRIIINQLVIGSNVLHF